MYDLIIIGGGPAGVAAGVYAARKKLKTLLVTESFGGQSIDSMGIENWIGTVNISGPDLAKALEAHLRAYADGSVDIKTGIRATKIARGEGGFAVTAGDEVYNSKTVLITSGSSRRKLEVPGAKEFENKGITYCASCDGPLFSGQDVAVVGGGNAGFETAAQLLAYAKSVTLLHRGSTFKADEMTVDKVLAHRNMKGVLNAEIREVRGDKFASSIIYTDTATGTDHELPAAGVFVEIGLIPATSFVENTIPLNDNKQIIIDPHTQRTEVPGIWAAGDVTDVLYHQNNIAAGDAVRALEDIYLYVHTGK
ncbi:FAD-dependent oxidoreductase [Candidatus Parcubacteria bacterium]|nr:FAD-dependent oxidoreductase [Candidatus Parcubacteria bacterium]